MAAPREPGEAAFARRIDPAREPGLSPEQRRLMAQVEYAQRQRALQRRLRSRNVLLALGIGAVTFGICILRGRGTERFLDELEQEAEAARARARARAEGTAS
uniref:cytochrome c oxidase assembly factor 3 homolog, mitochondrial n=1 Tax=Agelaius phoeniceus TaxID=39638 RepID=UPI0023EDB1E1|nr:cytochrome c oxidase assembly factor 3 homolog, mitochondrial [Agelaius phoeniceus]